MATPKRLHASSPVLAYLRLMRPANMLTAVADILLGYAAGAAMQSGIGGNGSPESLNALLWLAFSSGCLYGGGVVFNDFFDADLDRTERPERPLPSGCASKNGAGTLALLLLSIGIFCSFQVSRVSGFLALSITFLAVIYDAFGKKREMMGPINMGLCRGANLMLGISAFPDQLTELWFLIFIPILYIATITMVSRGEVYGTESKILKSALMGYFFVILAVIALHFIPQFNFFFLFPSYLYLCIWCFPPYLKQLNLKSPAMWLRQLKPESYRWLC